MDAGRGGVRADERLEKKRYGKKISDPPLKRGGFRVSLRHFRNRSDFARTGKKRFDKKKIIREKRNMTTENQQIIEGIHQIKLMLMTNPVPTGTREQKEKLFNLIRESKIMGEKIGIDCETLEDLEEALKID